MADEKLNPNEFAISEDQFDLVDEVQATMSPNHDRLMIRKIDGIDLTYMNLATADLRQRTSTKNKRGTTCNWVDTPRTGNKGPAAGGREWPGIWRGVSVRGYMRGGQSSIIQTLAYGLIRSAEDVWPSPEIVRTDDRLLRPHAIQDDPTSTQKEIRYRGFDPSYVDAARAAVALTAGVIDVRSVRMQDGSYNIHVLTETLTWAAFVVTAPDTTSKHNYGTDFEEIVEVWNSIANDDALTGVYTTATRYRVNDVVIDDQLDGSVKVTRTQVAKKAFATGTPDFVWYENKTREREVMHQEWYGIAEDDAFTDLWTDPTGYSILSCPKSPGSNGVVKVERISALKNTWYTAVLSAGDADKIGTNAFAYTREGVLAGFKGTSYVSQHIPIADADDIVNSLMTGTNIKAWATGTAYAVGDIRSSGGLCYVCNATISSSAGTMILDIATEKWDRISEANYANSDGNVCSVVFDSQPAFEYGYLASVTPATGSQPREDSYVWTNVDPSRIATVWELAVAYTGEASDLTHRRVSKTFDNRGIATITSDAWTPILNISTSIDWSGQDENGIVANEIVQKDSEWNDQGDWCYKVITYNVHFFYDESDAYTYISDGFDGSGVFHVEAHVWKAIKVTGIVYGAWNPGPVNTAAPAP
jgi:hypothetical protein